jgi:hypothetical protein
MSKQLAAVAALLLAFFLIATGTTAQEATPDTAAAPTLTFLSFDKSAAAEGVWEGSVGGDVDGSLRTELRDLRMEGPIWFVEFDWIIDAGDQSFTARLNGTLNTLNGTVLMTGEVIEGAMLGATVYEQAELVNPETSRFQGTILVIEPAS